MIHFLLLTNDYHELFRFYKQLIKLKYVDGDIHTNFGSLDKNFFVDFDMNDLPKHFEYLEIIKSVHMYLLQNNYFVQI